ncbi:MAG: ribbon-helix-helix protein, CopG family [Eubacteriales bacterium]
MNKSVYSLVLSDEIVQEIDRMAYETGASRSAMINQILAEYVRYTTPEKRMREVFSAIEQMLLGSVFEPQLQPSESMFSLRSALDYKYNPSVRYSVELYKNARPLLGELRVSVRSQNSALVLAMLQFFKLWTRIEKQVHRTRRVRHGRRTLSSQASLNQRKSHQRADR